MKKALNIVKNILVWIIVVFSVLMMIFTVVSVNTFDRSDRSLFGYKAFIVLSDSMKATDFASGDLILVKEVDPSTLKEGDIISYTSQNSSNFGATVTHKIRMITTDQNGQPGFITYGTTTNTDDETVVTDDETVVTYDYVLGKYQTRLKGVGSFFQFLKTTPGYICCIFVPFALLILVQGINCIRLFKRYKMEQYKEIEDERTKLEQERAESQKMMSELLELKKQLQISSEQQTDEPQQPVAQAEETVAESQESVYATDSVQTGADANREN